MIESFEVGKTYQLAGNNWTFVVGSVATPRSDGMIRLQGKQFSLHGGVGQLMARNVPEADYSDWTEVTDGEGTELATSDEEE